MEKAFEGTGVPLLEDMADFSTGHGCESASALYGKPCANGSRANGVVTAGM